MDEGFIANVKGILTLSDRIIIRCYEYGVLVPDAWVIYRSELRAIIVAGSGDIPLCPTYPEGT